MTDRSVGDKDRPLGEIRHYHFLYTWQKKARENVDKWGLQDHETLVLAMMEELGELTQAVLEHEYENGDYQRLYDETADLGALVIQMHHRLERGHLDRDRERLDRSLHTYGDNRCSACRINIPVEGERHCPECKDWLNEYGLENRHLHTDSDRT